MNSGHEEDPSVMSVPDGPNQSWVRRITHHGPAIDTLAKVGAGLFLMVYISGFVVISMYEASFGVVNADLLRPKVLAAGVAFMVLSTLPAIVGFTFFRTSHGSELSAGERHAIFMVFTAGSMVMLHTLFSPAAPVDAAWLGLTVVTIRVIAAVGLVAFLVGLTRTATSRTRRPLIFGGAVVLSVFLLFDFPESMLLMLWFLNIGFVGLRAQDTGVR